MYAPAPIKRMSILERRKGDGRDFFLRHWHQVHGGMVSRMPFLYAYVQNHIVEDFPGAHPAFPGDGLVEQLWRSTGEMQRGYNSPVVKDLIADEVNYLGHGSNYAILASAPLAEVPEGTKLVAALRHAGDVDLADAVANAAKEFAPVLRDDVIATIAKPNFLPVQPHPADMFLHLTFPDAATAAVAGRRLTEAVNALVLRPAAAFALWRVTTRTIVAPS